MAIIYVHLVEVLLVKEGASAFSCQPTVNVD